MYNEYAKSIAKLFKWNSTILIRTHYLLKDYLMDKKVSSLVKSKNIDAVFYTIENDRDRWSQTSSINYAHLLVKGRNVTKEIVSKGLNINPKAVIGIEEIRGRKAITSYITKSMWQKESHHNLFY